MKNFLQNRNFFIILSLSALTLLMLLPVILYPEILLNRGNDLEEFFWPIFYSTKYQILNNHTLPLWNTLFLSGTPLLPDPQSPLFYLPNIIFLLLPIDNAFIVTFILHGFLGGLGMYFVAKMGFKFSKNISLFLSIIYIVFPRMAGFLEAGHFGLVLSNAWLPFLFLAVIMLIKKPQLKWSLILSISLSGIFFTHPTTFVISLATTIIVLSGYTIRYLYKSKNKFNIIYSILGLGITLGLISVTLLPQLEWLPQTTRFLLLSDRDVYPKWESKIEFIKALFPFITANSQFVYNLDTEKWIPIGIFPFILSFIGFIYLKRSQKIIILLITLGVVLVSLNNVSPIYNFLISIDWYKLARVSTRVWFITVFMVVVLIGLGLESLITKKHRKIAIILAFLSIIELVSLSWYRLLRPLSPAKDYASIPLYEFLAKDKEYFRVFCVNKCLSQKQAAKYKLQLTEGYSTLQQKNYFEYFIQLDQVYWTKYSLSLPPIEIYNYREIQPHAPTLSDYNIKYVISPHELQDSKLVLEQKFGNYLVYRNLLVKPRAYFLNTTDTNIEAPILIYNPNLISIDTSKNLSEQIVLSEVYSAGWKAYLNGKKEIEVKEGSNKLRRIEIEDNTKYVDFVYNPPGYSLGSKITLTTLFLTISLLIFRRKFSKMNYLS